MTIQSLPNIISVEAKENYILRIIFDDGLVKELSIKPFIKKGVSSSLKDEDFFKKVRAENGYITWPNGFDFCPEFLRNYV